MAAVVDTVEPIALGDFAITFGNEVEYSALGELIAEALEFVRSFGIQTKTHGFGTNIEGPETAMYKVFMKFNHIVDHSLMKTF